MIFKVFAGVQPLERVYVIFSAGELEEGKVGKPKGGNLMKNDGL